jgi:hypothetical protein
MDAKEYLAQLGKLRNKIEQDRDYLRDKRYKSIGGGSLTGDAERVQSSPSLDGPYNAIIECVDLEKKIEAEVISYNMKWQEIVSTINEINNPNYSKVLYLHWVQQEKMSCIAKTMYLHPKSLSRIHKQALIELQKILDKR